MAEPFNNHPPSNLTLCLVERVLSQGEARLNAQLQIALAADSRAMTSASIFVGVASALVGYAGFVFSTTTPNLPLGIAALIGGAAMMVSAILCAFAARPTEFRLVGANPDNWWQDDVTNKPYSECIWRESQNYSTRIRENVSTLGTNAARVNLAMMIAVCTPAICLLSWAVVRAAS